MDVSLAIAAGVATVVWSTGRPVCSATSATSGGGANPPVISTQGKSTRQRQPQGAEPRRRVEAFEIPDLALAEDQHAARPQVLVKTGEREPVF